MIASLKGLVQTVGTDHAVIDVGGVGYLVQASAQTLAWLGGPADPAGMMVHVEMVVRQDAITLYAFRTPAERAIFRRLQTIQGVGSRVSLAILSTLSVEELAQAVALEDAAMLARAPGVGPKLARRIATELKDKLADFAGLTGTAPATAPAAGSASAEAMSALANLGYRPAEAARAVAEAERALGEGAPLGDLIREALKRASR